MQLLEWLVVVFQELKWLGHTGHGTGCTFDFFCECVKCGKPELFLRIFESFYKQLQLLLESFIFFRLV